MFCLENSKYFLKNGVAMTFVFCVSNHFINRLELRLASVVDGSEVEP